MSSENLAKWPVSGQIAGKDAAELESKIGVKKTTINFAVPQGISG